MINFILEAIQILQNMYKFQLQQKHVLINLKIECFIKKMFFIIV